MMIRIYETENPRRCYLCESKEGVKVISFSPAEPCLGMNGITIPLCEHCRQLLVAEVSDDLNGYICEPKEGKYEE